MPITTRDFPLLIQPTTPSKKSPKAKSPKRKSTGVTPTTPKPGQKWPSIIGPDVPKKK